MCFHANLIFAEITEKNEVPHYKIDVSYDHDKTLLAGKMQVRFTRRAFPKNELIFALPGNRFLAQDDRGTRKHRIVPVFRFVLSRIILKIQKHQKVSVMEA